MATLIAPAPPTRTPHDQPKRTGRSLSVVQRLVIAAAALPLLGIVATAIAGATGAISTEQMIDVSLGLGEEPGMLVFAAMLWCSPIQWLVRRTQVPVRKMLGILFGGYAVANFSMFVVEQGVADSVSRPFLIAGTLATLAAIPLVLTSGRWAQRRMGMKNWRRLHKLTYLIAGALVLHVALIGEVGISGMLIVAALVTRIPPIANAINRLGEHRRDLRSGRIVGEPIN